MKICCREWKQQCAEKNISNRINKNAYYFIMKHSQNILLTHKFVILRYTILYVLKIAEEPYILHVPRKAEITEVIAYIWSARKNTATLHDSGVGVV